MPIAATCNCGMKFALGDGMAGHRVRCPKCRATVQVPWRQRPPAVPTRSKTPTPRPVKRSKEEVRVAVQRAMTKAGVAPLLEEDEQEQEGPVHPLAKAASGAVVLLLCVFAVMLKVHRPPTST